MLHVREKELLNDPPLSMGRCGGFKLLALPTLSKVWGRVSPSPTNRARNFLMPQEHSQEVACSGSVIVTCFFLDCRPEGLGRPPGRGLLPI